MGASAGRRDGARRVVELLDATGAEHHVGAGLGEGVGEGDADAAGGAGDDDDLVVEAEHVAGDGHGADPDVVARRAGAGTGSGTAVGQCAAAGRAPTGSRAPARRRRRTRCRRRPAPARCRSRAQRPPGQLADRHRDERAEHVVGVGAAEHVVVDVLLHGERPAHREHLDPIAADEGRGDQRDDHGVDAQHQHRQRRRARSRSCPRTAAARGGSAAGPAPSGAGPAASAESTKPHAWRPIVSSATTGPRVKRAPLWIMLRAPKPSTTTHSQVDAAEEGPALAQVGQVGSPRRSRPRRDLHREQQERRRAAQVEGVDGQGPAGAGGDHDEGAERRTEDGEAVAGQRQQRVGLLERLARHQLGDQARHRRHRDRRHRAVDGGTARSSSTAPRAR